MKTKADSVQSSNWETMPPKCVTPIISGEYLTPSNPTNKLSREIFEPPLRKTFQPAKHTTAYFITIITAEKTQKENVKSLYDTRKVQQSKNTKHLLNIIDEYINNPNTTLPNCTRVSSEQLKNIRKEVLLLSPFLDKGKLSASLDTSFDGLIISLTNALNTISLVAKGNHQISFSYLLKEKRSSVAIDGLIDLEEDEDNINFKGLEKLLSIYSGA